jgi:PAS domain S-box-containing protein
MNPRPDAFDHPACLLIVDDERHNRQLLEVMLGSEGFRLLSASSGEEALAIVPVECPDLILLDVMMPGMDGYQVAARLKGDASTKHIPIIMVTALDTRESKMLGLNAGAEDFLTKPVDRAELSVRVRNLLRLKAYADYHDKYSGMLEGEVLARTADLVAQTKSLEQSAIALRKSKERTNYALGAARTGVWQVDVVTGRATWSETMAPLFGLAYDASPDGSAGALNLIHPDDRPMVESAMAEAARGGPDVEVEFRVVWPDGATHWLAARGRLLRDADGTPARLLGIGTDVSERKSLEAQFRQSQKMEAVGQLAGGVAHDFNNLLTAILGYSNFVIDTLEPGDPRRADMDEVVKAGHRAAGLTKQLLAFSRKQVLKPTAVDVNALIKGMHQLLSRLIGEHVDLVTALAPGLSPVRADRGQLEQVLMNLVVNARDAMPSGGRLAIETANAELDASFMADVVVAPGSYVMLAVSDSGVGMTEATRQRLFEPFFTTKEAGRGTGLGLATVYGIVKQSGGYIWVFSELGKGASFKVFLPCAHRGDEVEDSDEGPDAVVRGTENVLLVEDDEPVRHLMRAILERAGYHVADATNPEHAEALFAEDGKRFNLIVTDVIMPGSSGPSMFERLTTHRPDLRVLYVSGYTDDTIVRQGQLKHGVEFLQKPFTADALTRRVREVLDR